MKKICFFMSSPFTVGGEQRVVTTLANFLKKKDYEVYLMLTASNKLVDYNIYKLDKKIKIIFVEEYNKLGHKILRKGFNLLKKINMKVNILKNFLGIQKNIYCNWLDKNVLKKYINKYKFDCIIGLASEYSGILAVLKEEIPKCKLIGWQHSCYNAYFKTRGRRFFNEEKFVKYMFENLNEYVVQTMDDYEKIAKEYAFRAKVIGNPNTFIKQGECKLGNKRFIAAGRFDWVKNFEGLIEAFYKFSLSNKEWNLYIFGDGKNKENCNHLINKYKLENRVFLLGKSFDMKKEYMNSSVYLMTSKWEGWGMVVTEAMQFGLPVISYDLPCIREIFGNENCGIIVKKFDIEQYSLAMNEIIKSKTELEKMSKNAKERIKKFDVNIIGEYWYDLIEEE